MKVSKPLECSRGKRRCCFCKSWFQPNPRNPRRQKTCSKPACQKKRKAENNRRWQKKNPGYGKSRRREIRTWAREYPDYWRKYRKKHPDYAERERQRMRSARRKAKNVAKQDSVYRRVDGILKYLFWQETVAKQDLISFTPAPAS